MPFGGVGSVTKMALVWLGRQGTFCAVLASDAMASNVPQHCLPRGLQILWNCAGDTGSWARDAVCSRPIFLTPQLANLDFQIVLAGGKELAISSCHACRQPSLPLMILPGISMERVRGPSAETLNLFQILGALIERGCSANPQAVTAEPCALLAVRHGCQLDNPMDVIAGDGRAVLKAEQGLLCGTSQDSTSPSLQVRGLGKGKNPRSGSGFGWCLGCTGRSCCRRGR